MPSNTLVTCKLLIGMNKIWFCKVLNCKTLLLSVLCGALWTMVYNYSYAIQFYHAITMLTAQNQAFNKLLMNTITLRIMAKYFAFSTEWLIRERQLSKWPWLIFLHVSVLATFKMPKRRIDFQNDSNKNEIFWLFSTDKWIFYEYNNNDKEERRINHTLSQNVC